MRLLVVVNKAQIYPVNICYETHHTSTHIAQSIKLRHHIKPAFKVFIFIFLLVKCVEHTKLAEEKYKGSANIKWFDNVR